MVHISQTDKDGLKIVQKPFSSDSSASQGNISRLLPTCQILGPDESVLGFRKLDQEGCI